MSSKSKRQLPVAELAQIAVERGEHRPVELGHILGIGLAGDLEVVLDEVENHRRRAGSGLNVELVAHRSGSQMVALSAKNA